MIKSLPLMLILLGHAVSSDDPAGYRLEKIPLPKIKAQETPAAQEGSESTGPPMTGDSKPVDARPVVFRYTMANCAPCAQQATDIKAGKLSEYTIVDKAAPEWVDSYPTLHYQAADGSWKKFEGWGPGDLEKFKRQLASVNPPKVPAAKPKPADKPLPIGIQIHKYLGNSGSLVFRPKVPVSVEMPNGAKLRYEALNVDYVATDETVELTFKEPLPEGAIRMLGFDVGFQLLWAKGPFQGDKPGEAKILVRTNRGTQKVTVKMEAE